MNKDGKETKEMRQITETVGTVRERERERESISLEDRKIKIDNIDTHEIYMLFGI